MPTLEQLKGAAPKYDEWAVHAVYEGLVIFGQRNEDVFPLTENGDILYKMAESGDALWIERPIDYSFVFPGRREAQSFCERVAIDGFRGELSKYRGAKG